MYLQLLGTAIGTKCATPYASPAALEEIKRFIDELPKVEVFPM